MTWLKVLATSSSMTLLRSHEWLQKDPEKDYPHATYTGYIRFREISTEKIRREWNY